MKLFHGSDILVHNPCIEMGRPFKDFGRGFYLSSDYNQAKEMAEQKSSQSLGKNPPVISTFEFDDSVMTDGTLKVKIFETYTKEWALFVLNNRNRNNTQPCHGYDIVYGPIADDRIVRQMRRFEMALQKLTFIC